MYHKLFLVNLEILSVNKSTLVVFSLDCMQGSGCLHTLFCQCAWNKKKKKKQQLFSRLFKDAALQEPSSLGHPRKWFGRLNFFAATPNTLPIGLLTSRLLPSGLFEIFVRQQPCYFQIISQCCDNSTRQSANYNMYVRMLTCKCYKI